MDLGERPGRARAVSKTQKLFLRIVNSEFVLLKFRSLLSECEKTHSFVLALYPA